MTRPDTRVDVAFDSTYSTPAASRTWTDLTDWALTAGGINIVHGRQDEHSQSGPNTCSLMLDNSDGRFTPGLASSPYYPNVKIGRPLRVATNLCTFGDNGTFEADAANWSGIAADVARTTTASHSGSAALEVTKSGAGDMSANTPGGTSGIPVVAGATYRASGWVRRPASSNNRTCDIRILWADSGGTTISTDTSASITDSGTWQQIILEATAPSTAAYARVRVQWTAPPGGEIHQLDDVRFDVDRFTGYIDEWPLEWPGVVGTFATSAISASSRMARLGLSDKLKSIVELEILADNPTAYYTLAEAEGATQANDSSGNEFAPMGPADWLDFPGQTAPTFGAATGPGTDGLSALQFSVSPVAGAILSTSKILRAHGSATVRAVEVFFATTGSTNGSNAMRLFTAGNLDSPSFELFVSLNQLQANGSSWALLGTSGVNDGTIRHACLRESGGNVEMYVDGSLVASTAGSLGAIDSFGIVAGADPDATTLTVAHLALYSTAPSAVRIADHADAGLDGFAAEEADNRLARYAGYAGIPAAEYSFSTAAVTPMAHIDTTGQGAVELMQKVATTDGGVLYDGRNGVLTYVDRAVRYNATAALTLNASAGRVEVGYAPKFDRSALKNKVTATASDGTYIVTAENTSSTAEYGSHGDSDLDLATTDNNEAHAAAWWRVNTYGEPSARAPQLKVELAKRSAANQAIILAVDVSDKIAVDNLPSQSDENDKSFFVEGYTETITDSQHFIEFNVSPTTGFEVWEVGHATFGQYDAYPIAY